MRVLALTRYGRLGASSRLRMLQYIPALQRAGIEVSVSPLLDDRYVSAMYAGHRAAGSVVSGYLRRIARLLAARRFDVVWLEKECLPWLPAWLELGLLPNSCKLVADYDDAWFHRYDRHCSFAVRRFLGSKVDVVMRRADSVTAGNDYLAQHARQAGAARVEILPTVIDLERYPVTPRRSADETVVIGWMGTPNTAPLLRIVAAALEQLRARHRLHCVAVGARPDQVVGTPFESRSWTESGEVDALQEFDIGIMPLPDDPWHRGKCGYKLLQYMACGLPVVASPVGVNTEIILPGVNGELAGSDAEWVDALLKLCESPEMCRRMGAAGRRIVEERYSLGVQAPRLVETLQSVISG